jgi:hypothetical protein
MEDRGDVHEKERLLRIREAVEDKRQSVKDSGEIDEKR